MKHIVFLALYALIYETDANDNGVSCCRLLPVHSHCRRACRQLRSSASVSDQLDSLIRISDICHQNIDIFWSCANSSYSVLREVDQWPGRICCGDASGHRCSVKCKLARSIKETELHCHRNDEPILYSCFKKLRESASCCNKGTSSSCRSICHYLAYNGYTVASHQLVLRQVCSSDEAAVMKCGHTRNKTSTQAAAPYQYHSRRSLHCCRKAVTSRCRKTCKHVLVMSSDQDAIKELIRTCGIRLLPNSLWDCFLKTSATKSSRKVNGHSKYISKMTIYGAKLHCCVKAASDECYRLCTGVYSRNWNNRWQQFEKECLSYNPQLPKERSLRSCLADLEEPCTVGCKSLSFCTNFNNRPSEMFRGCNAKSDLSARKQFENWKSGVITMPHFSIPVIDIMRCEPEIWKTVACLIQIKPCHSHRVPSPICRSDCLYILNKCILKDKLPEGQSVETLCEALSPYDGLTNCIPVSKYIRKPNRVDGSLITSPCQSNPCPEGKVCIVNRHKCKNPRNYHSYICKHACSVGEVSSFMVRHGTWVQLPIVSNVHLQISLNCQRTCKCTHRGNLDQCVDLPCRVDKNCVLYDQTVIEAGKKYTSKCGSCICHSGKAFCTRERCMNTVPCSCDASYEPVCASNGVTYASRCLARCAGFHEHDISQGHCSDLLVCRRHSCQSDTHCLPRRVKCLGTSFTTCRQYYCIKEQLNNCNRHKHIPVCSKEGREFNNPCGLLHRGREFMYFGRCEKNCSMDGVVCGVDGSTYPNECSCLSAGVFVDYAGKCRIFGTYGKSFSKACDKITCPKVIPQSCMGIVPPGACCPVCATQLRVLYHKELADHVTHIQKFPLTVGQVVSELSSLITVVECRLFAYLDTQNDIIVLVKATGVTISPTQVKVCQREAAYLSHLISTSSPIIQTRLALSPLLISPVSFVKLKAHYRSSHLSSSYIPHFHSSLTLLCNVFIYLLIKW